MLFRRMQVYILFGFEVRIYKYAFGITDTSALNAILVKKYKSNEATNSILYINRRDNNS